MTDKKKDWFDKHVIVKTLNDDKDAEKKLTKEIKKIYENRQRGKKSWQEISTRVKSIV